MKMTRFAARTGKEAPLADAGRVALKRDRSEAEPRRLSVVQWFKCRKNTSVELKEAADSNIVA